MADSTSRCRDWALGAVLLLAATSGAQSGGYKTRVTITSTQTTKYASLQIEARSAEEGLVFTYVCSLHSDLCHAPIVGKEYRMLPSIFHQYKCDNYELHGQKEEPIDLCLDTVRKE